MNAPASITISIVHVADLLAEGERMPVNVCVIDHPHASVCYLMAPGSLQSQ